LAPAAARSDHADTLYGIQGGLAMRPDSCLLLGIAFCIVATAPSVAQSKGKRSDPEQIGNRDVGKGVNFYSLEREIALGKQMAQEIERQAKLIDAPAPAEYINRLAQNLARTSDLKVPVIAKLIDSSEVNAFALPGGFLFVNSGLMVKTESEAELAGVMAHEIAHVAARHGTRQASRGQLVNFASLPLIFLGGWPGFAVRQGASLAVPVAFLKFSRGFEREADLLGLQYIYKAGYEPNAFIDFFERMEAAERRKPGTVSELFRSHPSAAARIQVTQKNIQELLKAQPQYVIDTSEFQQIRQELNRAMKGRKETPQNSGPTLRRSTRRDGKTADGGESSPPDRDERPTLKRRQP
jgi:predicted Zn-dependent protease